MIHRRQLLTGLIGLIAAPAIVRATSLMPIKSWIDDGIALNSMSHPPGPDFVEFTIRGLDAFGKKTIERLWVALEEVEDHRPIITKQSFASITGIYRVPLPPMPDGAVHIEGAVHIRGKS